MLLIVLDKDQE